MAPMASGRTTKTVEFVGDATSVTKAAQKMVADLERAAEQIQRLNLGKGIEDLPKTAQQAAQQTAAKLRELQDLKLAKKTLEVDLELDKARADLRRFEAAADDSGDRVRRSLGSGVGDGLRNSLSGVTSQLGPLGSAIDDVAGSFGTMSLGGTAALGVIAGGAFVVQRSVAAWQQQVKVTREFQAVARTSTEDASRFVNAMDDLGISTESGAKAIGALTRNLDTKKFEDLGISIAKTKTGATDVVGTFRNILVELDRTSDAQQRANILAAAFGRSYQDILPLIERGAKGFDQLLKSNEGNLITERDKKRAEELRKVMDDLGDTVGEVQLAVARFAIPWIVGTANSVQKITDNIRGMGDAIRDLPAGGPALDFLGKVAKFAGDVAISTTLLRSSADDTSGALGGMNRALDRAIESLRSTGTAAAKTADDVEKTQKAIDAQARAALGMGAAQDRASEALARLNLGAEEAEERQKALAAAEEERARKGEAVERARAQLVATRVSNAREVESAEKAIGAARDRVREATDRVSSAEQGLVRAKQDAATAAQRASDADRAYQQVLRGVGSEADAAKSALLDLNDAKAGVSSAELGVRSAERRLADARREAQQTVDSTRIDNERRLAQIDLEEASQLVARAERRKTEAQQRGVVSAEDLADLDREIERARIEQSTRTAELTRRIQDLSDTTDEAAVSADNVRAAELEVDRARRQLEESTRKAADAQGEYDGVVSGYPATSGKARDAEKDRAKAIDDAAAAEKKVTDATATVEGAKAARKKAADDVTTAEGNLRTKIDEARRAEADRVTELKNAQRELDNVRPKLKEHADRNGEIRDRVREAVDAQIDFIKQSAAAKGQVVTDAEAIERALAAVRAQALKLGAPDVVDAVNVLAGPVRAAVGGGNRAVQGPPAPAGTPVVGGAIVPTRAGSNAARFEAELAAVLAPRLQALGIPASAVPGFVAQVALETANGTSTNYRSRNNIAGIRGAAVTASNTRGYRTYDSVGDGVDAYLALLQRSYGRVLDAGRTGDPNAVARAFGNSPWATSRYRLGARGDEDAIGDAGGIVGRVGTEGQALIQRIAQIRGFSVSQAASAMSSARGWLTGTTRPDPRQTREAAAVTGKETADRVNPKLDQSKELLRLLRADGLSESEANNRLGKAMLAANGDIERAARALGLDVRAGSARTADELEGIAELLGDDGMSFGAAVAVFADAVAVFAGSGGAGGFAGGSGAGGGVISLRPGELRQGPDGNWLMWDGSKWVQTTSGGRGGSVIPIGPSGPPQKTLPELTAGTEGEVRQELDGSWWIYRNGRWEKFAPGETIVAPKLASGGYFMPRPGGHLGVLAEAGVPEFAAPEPMLRDIVRSESGSGIVIHQLTVTTAATDGRRFAEELYDGLKELARRRGDVTGGAWKVAVG